MMNEKTPACQAEEHDPERLILPSAYYIPRKDGEGRYDLPYPRKIDPQQMELCSDLAILRQRLAIVALIDMDMLQQGLNGGRSWVGPTPLLHLDGQPPSQPEDIGSLRVTRHYFYSPRGVKTDGGVAYLLDPRGRYAGSLDTGIGETHGPATTYISNAYDPSDADGKIFEKPLPYDQDAYDQAVKAWREEIARARLARIRPLGVV